MDAAFESVAPLTPTMWGFTAADVQEQASQLTYNFAGVAREYYHPYTHPIANAWETHPLHTLALNKRQFDVLRYGAVLDEATGLVVVSAPGELVDSGILVAQEYASLCNKPLVDPETVVHPLLAEYTLLIYRCNVNDAADKPELLFRLVFRNEAHQQTATALTDWSTFFPMFHLRAVYVPSDLVYPHMSELTRYRQSNPAYLTNASGARVANPRVHEMLFRPPLSTLCDLWMTVLHAIVPPLPSRVRRVELEADAVNSFFNTHQMLLNGAPTNAATPGCDNGYQHDGTGFVEGRTGFSYRSNMDRLQRRVTVVPRTPATLRAWRDGELDMSYVRHKALQGRFLPSVQTEDSETVRSPCVRMLLLPERRALNFFDGRELCAFLPPRSEYENPTVYRTEAAECLRLWILKGLVLAELLHVHALFLDLDPVMLLSQCASLLWDDGETPTTDTDSESADRQHTYFYLCKIVLETVEDFLQHSGVVWRVVVGVREGEGPGADGLCAMCEEILTFVRVAKLEVEVVRAEALAAEAATDPDGTVRDADLVAASNTLTRPVPAYCSALVASLRGPSANGALAVRDVDTPSAAAVGPPSQAFAALRRAHERELPARTLYNAAVRRVFLFDRDLFPIFVSLCGPYNEEVPVKLLVEVLQLKLDPQEENKFPALWPFEHPLVPLDHCGVPYNEERLAAFVSKFAMKSFAHNPAATRAEHQALEPSLNYVEFSMLMLHLGSQ